jgi:hypothetical protein
MANLSQRIINKFAPQARGRISQMPMISFGSNLQAFPGVLQKPPLFA